MRSVNITLAILFTALSVITRAQQHANDLIGRWSVDLNRTVNAMDSENKLRYDSMPDHVKNHMRTSFQERIFDFGDNQKIAISFPIRGEHHHVEGRWTYSQEHRTLTIETEKENRSYQVQWETVDAIELLFKVSSGGGMLNSLFLTREN